MDEEDELGGSQLLVRLCRALRNEQLAPELLLYQNEIVSSVMEELDRLEDLLESYRDVQKTLHEKMCQMELDRIRYLLRSYLRSRLKKIERFCFYFSENASSHALLSDNELEYLSGYVDSLRTHLYDSFLKHIPDAYQSVGVPTRIEDTMPEPQLDVHVFCRVLGEIGVLDIDEETSFDLQVNHTYVLRYRHVRTFVFDGRMELV